MGDIPMTENITVDLCVIGAGSGGLSVAAGASQLGASVVLLEKGKMGGDCLNYGCVPSKALLAAGHAADAARRTAPFGVNAPVPTIDGKAVYDHVAGVIGAIAPNDSVERFEGLGVRVIQEAGQFLCGNRVQAGDTIISARRFVVATGSSAFIPPIPGLDEVTYHTNEDIFSLGSLPEHLIVIGGGPIGIEMAQAHRHLGCKVTVLELFSIMPKDDADLVAVVRRQLEADGIDIREGVKIARVEKDGDSISVVLDDAGTETRITGSNLLVATGRKANVDGLGLENAGVRFSPKGIHVDARLRTTNRKIYAIGDVAGGFQFTHMAGYHAGIIIRNVLFKMPAKVDERAVPWVTYTAPELAQVGMTEEIARKAGHADLKILRWSFAENDRAQAERATDGLIKVICTPKGKILGAGIAGKSAGELIQPWILAISQNLKIGAMANIIAPYPTLAEVNKRVAGSFFTAKLFSERTKKIVRFLLRLG